MKDNVQKYLKESFKGHEISEITQVGDWDGYLCFRAILDNNIFSSLYILAKDREVVPVGLDSINDGMNDGEFWEIDESNGNYFKSRWEEINKDSDE